VDPACSWHGFKIFFDYRGQNLGITPDQGHPDPAKIMKDAGRCV
jgi:hypothetical protein